MCYTISHAPINTLPNNRARRHPAAPARGGGGRHQPPRPARPGAHAAGAHRPQGVRAAARLGVAAGDPGYCHPRCPAGRGRRPRCRGPVGYARLLKGRKARVDQDTHRTAYVQLNKHCKKADGGVLGRRGGGPVPRGVAGRDRGGPRGRVVAGGAAPRQGPGRVEAAHHGGDADVLPPLRRGDARGGVVRCWDGVVVGGICQYVGIEVWSRSI